MKIAVLPCNGLDKSLGSLSREVALQLADEDGCELICPVFCNNSPDRYAKSLSELPLLVIDGCATRCATKLANRLELKIDDRIQLVDEIKRLGGSVGKSLILGEPERELARRIVADWTRRQAEEPVGAAGVASATFVASDGIPGGHPRQVRLQGSRQRLLLQRKRRLGSGEWHSSAGRDLRFRPAATERHQLLPAAGSRPGNRSVRRRGLDREFQGHERPGVAGLGPDRGRQSGPRRCPGND